MRRVHIVILTVLFLVVYMSPPIAKAEMVIDAPFLKIKVIMDGKPEKSSMVVNLKVRYDKEENFKWATWDSVSITPDSLNGGKRVVLRSDHYETGVLHTGRIRKLTVSGNRVTFDLIRSIGEPVHIVCVKQGNDDYDFRGTSTYYSNIVKKTMTEEWVLTDYLTLPSKEVFGYPERAEKAPKKRR